MLYGLLPSCGGVAFDTSTSIPDLKDRVIIITGGSTGLGAQTALELAQHNAGHIYICARNVDRAHATMNAIRRVVPCAHVGFLHCDLGDLNSVQKMAREFVAIESRLDVLILNAGIMAVPPATTAQGYEIQFGTNHVGHALLTKLLLPLMLSTLEHKTADVRVVALSSVGHTMAPAPGIVFPQLRSDMAGRKGLLCQMLNTMRLYGQSKLANILFVREFARRYPNITAVAVHPGVVGTPLYGPLEKWPLVGAIIPWVVWKLLSSVEAGAQNQIWAAVGARDTLVSGDYYTPIGLPGQGSTQSTDEGLARKLWEWTEEELKGYEL